MSVLSKKFTDSSWFHGGGGGLLAGVCCVLHAVAVAIGFSAGAVLFSRWMVDYRNYFIAVGMVFMIVTFFWSIKKHKMSTKKAIFTHLVIMVLTFAVVFALLNIFLFLTN